MTPLARYLDAWTILDDAAAAIRTDVPGCWDLRYVLRSCQANPELMTLHYSEVLTRELHEMAVQSLGYWPGQPSNHYTAIAAVRRSARCVDASAD